MQIYGDSLRRDIKGHEIHCDAYRFFISSVYSNLLFIHDGSFMSLFASEWIRMLSSENR